MAESGVVQIEGVVTSDDIPYRLQWYPGQMFQATWEHELVPYTRMTTRSAAFNKQAVRYISNQNLLRDLTMILMLEADGLKRGHDGAIVPFFAEGQVVRMKSTVWRPRAADTSNLLKAIEDSMKGVLYKDDRQIDDVQCKRYIEKGIPWKFEFTMEADLDS